MMSQQINATTLCSAWNNSGTQTITNATISLANNGSNDLLTVTAASTCTGGGGPFGTVATGGNYVSATVTFTNSTIQWNPTTDTLTFTLGTKVGTVRTGVGAGYPGYTASAIAKDMFSNLVSTVLFTSGSLSGF